MPGSIRRRLLSSTPKSSSLKRYAKLGVKGHRAREQRNKVTHIKPTAEPWAFAARVNDQLPVHRSRLLSDIANEARDTVHIVERVGEQAHLQRAGIFHILLPGDLPQ